MSARTPWQRRGIAVLGGMLATLGHAPLQFTPAFIVAMMIFVWLLDAIHPREKRLSSAFATGWWFGVGHFSTGLYWVSSAFLVDSVAWGPIWGVPATIALASIMALYWGLGALLAMLLWTNDYRRAASFALAMFAVEWVRGNFPFGGFPWLLPGYVWTPGEPISQLASVFGIYGLSLITLLFAAAPATVADGQVDAARRFAPMVLTGLAIGMIWGWGEQRLANAPVEPPGAQPIVRVADSGLSQAEKWRSRPDQEWRVLGRYLDASGDTQESRASIVVWPEGAIPVVNFFMLENPAFLDELGRGLGDRALISGLTRREARGSEAVYFNSAAVIDGVSGAPRLAQIYDKHHLVPVGEYIPLWSLVSKLNIAPLQRIGAGFERGPPPSRLVIPEASPAVVLICYEAIFPDVIPRGEGRPGWIINVTNDAWFGGLEWFSGPWQHFAMARYRTIEEGLPMARAASGGVSAIVDSFGRAVRTTTSAPYFAEYQLPPSLSETPYARWGYILHLGLLVIIATLRLVPPMGVARRVSG
jgi:apolipoprotein N-acyltransferase